MTLQHRHFVLVLLVAALAMPGVVLAKSCCCADTQPSTTSIQQQTCPMSGCHVQDHLPGADRRDERVTVNAGIPTAHVKSWTRTATPAILATALVAPPSATRLFTVIHPRDPNPGAHSLFLPLRL